MIIFYTDGYVTLKNKLIILPLKYALDAFNVLTSLFFDWINYTLWLYWQSAILYFKWAQTILIFQICHCQMFTRWLSVTYVGLNTMTCCRNTRLCELCLFLPLQFLVAKGETLSWILQQCLKKKQISCFLHWITPSQNEPLLLQDFLCSLSVGVFQQCGKRNTKWFGLAVVFKGHLVHLPPSGRDTFC